jgi:hypothetical protein
MNTLTAFPGNHLRNAEPTLWSTLRWNELHRRQPALATMALLFALAIVPCLIAMSVDTRTINDISVWIKPTKFLLSLAVYFATLAWCFGFLPASSQQTRAGRFVIIAPLVAGGLEMAWLLSAAVLGVPAHFNRQSVGWGLAYNAAGAGAVLLLAAIVVQGRMIARDRTLDIAPTLRRALVLGAMLSAGATLVSATVLSAGSGHWVGGTPSDVGGLPLIGWSRRGGDLRVAHFFALHLQQALALLGWYVARSRFAARTRLIDAAAAAMLAFTLFTFVQALLGRPFIG